MKKLDISREHIYEMAHKQGFQRDTLEKVLRLYYVLKDMSENPLLSDNLALKGGTAINFAYFHLPRLSVDIDMDFTKSGIMEDILPYRKEIKHTLFDLLQSQGYTIGKLGKECHTLDQWTFNYKSVTGNNDHIKVELNYGLRNHILPVVKKNINLNIVSDVGINIHTLHPCELFATKINALIERAAVRDLFDVYLLSKSDLLSTPEERELLKKGIVFYQTIGVEGKATKDINISKIMDVQPSKIKSQLMPLLPSGKKFFSIDIAKESTTQYLTSVLALSSMEREYLENFSKGIYMPDLLFSDPEIIKRIADHPMAIWKTEPPEIGINPNQLLATCDIEFKEAIKNNDYARLACLKDRGFMPSPAAINELKGSALVQTIRIVHKIFNIPVDMPVLKLVQSDLDINPINKQIEKTI